MSGTTRQSRRSRNQKKGPSRAQIRRQQHLRSLTKQLDRLAVVSASIGNMMAENYWSERRPEAYENMVHLSNLLEEAELAVSQDAAWVEVLEYLRKARLSDTTCELSQALRDSERRISNTKLELANRLEEEYKNLRELCHELVGKTLTEMYLPPL